MAGSPELCDDELYSFLFQPKDFYDGRSNYNNVVSEDVAYYVSESGGQGQARQEMTMNQMEMSEFHFSLENGHYLELDDLLSPLSSSPPSPSSDITSCLSMDSDYSFFDSLRYSDHVPVIKTEEDSVSGSVLENEGVLAAASSENNCSDRRNKKKDKGRKYLCFKPF